MEFLRFGQVLRWICPVAVVAMTLVWAFSSWSWQGVVVLTAPALVASRLTAIAISTLWSLIAMVALLGWNTTGADRPFAAD